MMSGGDSIPHVQVALGLVIRNGLVLITRRRLSDPFGGYWEFPGGKCEGEERPCDCVRRELEEELLIQVAPTHALPRIDHQYPHIRVTLHPLICRLLEGEPSPQCAMELAWVRPNELSNYQFPLANRTLLQRLIDGTWSAITEPL